MNLLGIGKRLPGGLSWWQARKKSQNTIFIIGMYKSGTSWLLRALSAHPELLGLLEMDIVSACDPESGRDLGSIFGRTSFCHFKRGELPETPVEEMDSATFRRFIRKDGRSPGRLAHKSVADVTYPIGMVDLSSKAVEALFKRVKKDGELAGSIRAFRYVLRKEVKGCRRLVFKGADQLSCFATLEKACPVEKKIIIMRDGRDAAISAMHYKRLMAERNANWLDGAESSFTDLLRAWCSRAEIAAELAVRNDVYLLSYEDLSTDFAGTLGRLLDWLGLESGHDIIDRIDRETRFETVTKGRKRGEEARHAIRKGQVGEWREVLNDDEKDKAWEIAGDLLKKFSYTRD